KRLAKEGSKLYLEGTDDSLTGSVVTLDACDRSFSRFTGYLPGEAIKCVTFNPARCLRIEYRKGTLRPDGDRDLMILNRSSNVLRMGHGKGLWKKE
ncbi:hypothetical protein BC827DRAFT_1142186, partial [Russula dissimulans]